MLSCKVWDLKILEVPNDGFLFVFHTFDTEGSVFGAVCFVGKCWSSAQLLGFSHQICTPRSLPIHLVLSFQGRWPLIGLCLREPGDSVVGKTAVWSWVERSSPDRKTYNSIHIDDHRSGPDKVSFEVLQLSVTTLRFATVHRKRHSVFSFILVQTLHCSEGKSCHMQNLICERERERWKIWRTLKGVRRKKSAVSDTSETGISPFRWL